jgi:hypothetical protein
LKKIAKRPKNSGKGAHRDRTERLQVILPADELAAIDEFRFQARMPSRAAAIRELLRRGLIASGELVKAKNPACAAVTREAEED